MSNERSSPVSPFLLYLNETALLFYPALDTQLGRDYVAQVTVESDGCVGPHMLTHGAHMLSARGRAPDTDTLAAFFFAQRDVTDAIIKLVAAHMHAPLPLPLELDGARYTVACRTKSWSYGRTFELRWAADTVVPCAEKWYCVFRKK